ncbi:60S ribosomal protein Nsa2, putative [Talaromyces marneffei ATCC 18224]|uniref:Ribosome biogenesis protein NSA2 homolog n=1 Tax=Talaromyces marneffei (strain ATCC 18224 / CBS 334.59 / QM 7333) TaxID=441960 RepID=B6QVY1_TALMQ|nr:60S ribosomal protein Nsa2, putative [Talaromyces marneffei ATCC 18224]
MQEILFVSLGTTVLDEIRIPGQKPLLNVLGGSGIYASLGARLFLSESQARSIGWIIQIGNDFPSDIEDDLTALGTTLVIDRKLNQPSTRGLLEYKDSAFGQKTFQYITPVLRIQTEQLNNQALFTAKSFHLFEWPQQLEERISNLLALRRQKGLVDQRPLIIWEPAPLSCEREQLSFFFSAAKLVDVFSPNHLELLRIFGEKPSTPFDRTQVEDLARKLLELGVGPDRTGIMIIRSGEHGSMMLVAGGVPHWIPPYYQASSLKVVDATGAGNAFLGAYAVAYLKTRDSQQAASYGSVAASFALEQIGVPHKIVSNGQELWNGVDISERLQSYIDQIISSTRINYTVELAEALVSLDHDSIRYERFQKTHGRRLDHEERTRKREAREGHLASQKAQSLRGLRAKMYAQKRHAEKIQMKKRIRAQEEKNVKSAAPSEPSSATPLPNYLLDRSQATNAKALSSAIKDKRSEKAAKFSVPLPKVKGISEEEMFKVVNTGKKTHKKSWKRMITKPTFVGQDFTRRNPKFERFIRPMGLRYKKANVTHPELGVTVQLPILSVKKNPQNPLYTQLGVLTKGTVIEVNVSELGLVTTSGKVVWGKYAQVSNNPDLDGTVNAVLLV